MSTSSLRPANKKSSGKKKNLVKGFSRISKTLLDDRLGVILINAPQLRLINRAFWDSL